MSERVNETLLLINQRVSGVRVWRQNTAKLPNLAGQWVQFGVPGMADISGIAGPGGWRLEIEMKPEKGRHRNRKVIERQAKWRRMVEGLGGIYITATSEEDAVDQLISALEDKRA